MSTDEERLDPFFASRLDQPALPDDGFTRAVTVRLSRHRRFRRLVFASGAAAATTIAAVAWHQSPGPLLSLAHLTPDVVIAMHLLAAACAFVWIATESPFSSIVRDR